MHSTSLRRPIYIINSVHQTKLPRNPPPPPLPHQRSTTISFETYPLIHLQEPTQMIDNVTFTVQTQSFLQ